jgi:hypothetical protein
MDHKVVQRSDGRKGSIVLYGKKKARSKFNCLFLKLNYIDVKIT